MPPPKFCCDVQTEDTAHGLGMLNDTLRRGDRAGRNPNMPKSGLKELRKLK